MGRSDFPCHPRFPMWLWMRGADSMFWRATPGSSKSSRTIFARCFLSIWRRWKVCASMSGVRIHFRDARSLDAILGTCALPPTGMCMFPLAPLGFLPSTRAAGVGWGSRSCWGSDAFRCSARGRPAQQLHVQAAAGKEHLVDGGFHMLELQVLHLALLNQQLR